MNNRHLGLRIDSDPLYKLHYVSRLSGRSANAQILHLIKEQIKNFEAAEGEIVVPEEKTEEKE